MNTKFTAKQLILVVLMAIALVAPRYPWYLSLNLESQVKFSIKFAISLIIVWIIIVFLVRDYRKDRIELVEKDENLHSDMNSVKNVVINHNYQKVNQRYQGNFSKLKNKKQDVDNIKLKKVSIEDDIAVIHRLRGLTNKSFEYLVWYLYKFMWYSIDKWPTYYGGKPLPDWWKDLIISKDNHIYVIQVKKYIDKYVSIKDVRELQWVLEKNEKWIFITTSIFPEEVQQYCDEKWMECIDYNDILSKIRWLELKDKEKLENYINDIKNIEKNPKYKPKTCKRCWAPFIKWEYSYFCWNHYSWCPCKEYMQ